MSRTVSARLVNWLTKRAASPSAGDAISAIDDSATRALPARVLDLPGLVPKSIWDRTTAKLHLRKGHPLCTLRETIEDYFEKRSPGEFLFARNLDPVVTVAACFDSLLVPPDHPSRSESDTYYVDAHHVLRTHMTAHNTELLHRKHHAFISCGDVYRRDTVDRTHYPVFHQVDGVRLFDREVSSEFVISDLKDSLEGLAGSLFGSGADIRWVGGEFPFTDPSFELEVLWGGEWLEVLGCGELRRGVLEHGGIKNGSQRGWAFGLGLERLAMVMFGIPDIRLFWSQDPRFIKQFQSGNLTTCFKPYSNFPPVSKDVAFWVESDAATGTPPFHENDVHECARDVGGDLIEQVECVDIFSRDGRTSRCYRITFRSMDKNLTHSEINELYHEIRSVIASRLPVSLR
jgi:phenylalanyl-tRNA synthetase alpha chain